MVNDQNNNRNADEIIVDEKPIIVHEVKELTDVMLNNQVTISSTLRQFLEDECIILVGVLGGRYTIYETKVREPFKLLKENRFIKEAHVQALMKSYEDDGYYFTLLYVNEILEEIDGQHRFESAMRKGLPVRFMIQPGWGIKEVTVLNVNSRVWTSRDHMESYANQGNINYIRFRDFFMNNVFDLSTCQLIVTGKRVRGRASEDNFRDGQLEVDEGHIIAAEKKVKMIKLIQKFHPAGWKSRNCVEALLTFFNTPDYDHEYLIKKLEKFPILMLAKANQRPMEDYIEMFLELYNRGRQKGKIQVNSRFV